MKDRFYYSLLVLIVLGFVALIVSDSKLSALGDRWPSESQQHMNDPVSQSKEIKENSQELMKELFDASESDAERSDLEALRVQLEKLEESQKCWFDPNCELEFEAQSPLDANSHFRKQTLDALIAIKDFLLKNPEYTGKFEYLFSSYVAHQDDFVKEQALEYFAWVEPNQERLEAIMGGLSQSSSVPLYDSATSLLKSYHQFGFGREVSSFISHQIRHGGFFLSRDLAKKSLEFMTPETFDIFHRLQEELPENSKTSRILQFSINEYLRSRKLSGQ